MLALSIGVGVACGLAAALLITLLNLATQLFFGTAHLGASHLWVIALPAVGGLLVGPLVTRFAPETRGHGVPEVMLAVARHQGQMRPRIAVVKTLASAITIGSGGSAGREGPIVQIGAAVGSAVGQVLREPPEIVRMLVACGSAGGIAASFNAPIAGVIFALEVILRDFTARAFAMVVAASVAASVLTRSLLGQEAFFRAPTYQLRTAWEMAFYVLLGVLAAVIARLFIRVLYATEDAFERSRLSPWLKPAIGGLLLGVVGYFLPQVFGTGHAPIETALAGKMALPILGALLLAKILATSLTLGSGGSGGVFAPSLFMGAMLGGAFGIVAEWLFPDLAGPAGGYAMVGMGAVFAGASFAPITAILIIFEMTHDYALILPLMGACVTSVLVSHAMSADSIYTLKLRRRGIDLHAVSASVGLTTIQVAQVMTRAVEAIPQNLSIGPLVERIQKSRHSGFPVVDDEGRLVGLVTYSELRAALADWEALQTVVVATDLMRGSPPVAHGGDTLDEVSARMRHHDVDRLPVVADDGTGHLIGIITDHDLINALAAGSAAGSSVTAAVRQPAASVPVAMGERT